MTFLRKGALQESPFGHWEVGADLAKRGKAEESAFEPTSTPLGHGLKGELAPAPSHKAARNRGWEEGTAGGSRRDKGCILDQEGVVRLG